MKRDRKIITAASAAGYLACSKQTIYRLYQSGKIEGFTVGKSVKLYADSVIDYEEKKYCC